MILYIYTAQLSPLQALIKSFDDIYFRYLMRKYMLLMCEGFQRWHQIVQFGHSNGANLAPKWPPNDAETRRPSDSCARIARASSLGSVALRGNFWARFGQLFYGPSCEGTFWGTPRGVLKPIVSAWFVIYLLCNRFIIW